MDVNKESKLLFVKMQKKRVCGRGSRGWSGGGGLVWGSGGCKPRIEGIVKCVWGGGFSQGDQSVGVNEGLKGCRSGMGSGWL